MSNDFMDGYRAASTQKPLAECYWDAGLGHRNNLYREGWNSYWADQISLAQIMQHDFNKMWGQK